MAIGAAVRTILAADATLQGLLGTSPMRVFPDMIPQNTPYPCAAYALIGTDPTNTKEGVSELDEIRLQFDVYDDNYDDVQTIAAQIRTVIDGYTGTSAGVVIDQVYFDGEQSGDYSEDLGIFWVSQTYQIHIKR